MKNIKCENCSTEMSSDAKACPKCGHPAPKKTSLLSIVIAAMVLIGVVQCTLKEEDSKNRAAATEAAMSPEQRAQKAAEEKRWQTAVGKARAAKASLKSAAKDPNSLEISSALLLDNETVCIVYRAKNSFGAVVPGYATVPAGTTIMTTSEATFNKHCSGKQGKNLIYGM